MKYLSALIGLLLIGASLTAQTYEYVYRNQQDSTINCYLKVIPNTSEISGLIIRDFSSLPDTSQKSRAEMHLMAAAKGFMSIFTVTSNRVPELYYFDEEPALLDDIIHEVIAEHNIPKANLFLGGISGSGTRALRFAQYCTQGKSEYDTQVRGVFAVDCPLDLERFFNSAQQHRKYLKGGIRQEADLILEAFPEYIGTPQQNREVYRNSSVFSHSNPNIGNAQYLLKTSLLLFHEPDIDWWLEERGASYSDINSFDIVAFVNKQLSNGNPDIELITTTQKGYDRQGERNCHSWTIVDEAYVMEWMVKRANSASHDK